MKQHLCSTDNLPSLLALLIFHDLLLVSSFLISQPLILTYLLLLSPYLLKLLLFLYPLFFSTFLLLLALLTVTFHLHDSPAPTSSAILNFLQAELVADEDKGSLTEQLCSMLFSYQMEPPLEDCNSGNQINQLVTISQNCNFLEDGNRAEENLGEKTEEEKGWSEQKPLLQSRKDHSRRPSEILQRDGSMRKEKEWKRTLACKLFEERMTYKLFDERKVVEGAEEMDLLWEAYEVDADKTEKQRKKKDAKKAVKEKVEEKEEEEEEEEEEEGISGKLCCLHALKLSTGKMNLGVGRPSLVKITMALKGMALFRRAGRRRKITK